MRLLSFGLLLLFPHTAFCQGFVAFRTYDPSGQVDAPVRIAGGESPGPSFTAQLFGGPLTSSKDALIPLLPVTHFRSGGITAGYYTDSVTVQVPQVPPGEQGLFYMRAYNNSSWETASIRGESALFSNPVGGVFPEPLVNLRAFTIYPVPEPNIRLLLLAGSSIMAAFRWARRHVHTPKYLLVFFTLSLGTAHPRAQGMVRFVTREPGTGIDIRTFLPNGGPPGPSFFAQLFGGVNGTSKASLNPLLPITQFRGDAPSTGFYIESVDIAVPGVASGTSGSFYWRAFNGSSWDTATIRGESEVFVNPTGDVPFPTVFITPVTLLPVPEPTSLAYAGLLLICYTAYALQRSIFQRCAEL
jgi:hypothetical protein